MLLMAEGMVGVFGPMALSTVPKVEAAVMMRVHLVGVIFDRIQLIRLSALVHHCMDAAVGQHGRRHPAFPPFKAGRRVREIPIVGSRPVRYLATKEYTKECTKGCGVR